MSIKKLFKKISNLLTRLHGNRIFAVSERELNLEVIVAHGINRLFNSHYGHDIQTEKDYALALKGYLHSVNNTFQTKLTSFVIWLIVAALALIFTFSKAEDLYEKMIIEHGPLACLVLFSIIKYLDKVPNILDSNCFNKSYNTAEKMSYEAYQKLIKMDVRKYSRLSFFKELFE